MAIGGKEKEKLGKVALGKIKQANKLIEELKSTNVGSLEARVSNIENFSIPDTQLHDTIAQLQSKVTALESKKGLCPQSLIV
jgi:hypothetical protein